MLLTILKAAFLRIVLQKSVFWLIENCFLVVVSWEKLYFIWWGVREGLYLCVTDVLTAFVAPTGRGVRNTLLYPRKNNLLPTFYLYFMVIMQRG